MTSSIRQTSLSTVRSVRCTRTRPTTLGEAVDAIAGDAYASKIAEIRDLQGAGKSTDANKLKKKLAAVMFAGTFRRRNNNELIDHSGLLVLDFDHCGVEKKRALGEDQYAVLCFVSPRGDGLKLVIRIDPATTPEEHAESFDAARDYFNETYGVDADPSGRDVSRLCFFSHDPDAIFKADGEVLHRGHRVHRGHKTLKTSKDIIDIECKGEERCEGVSPPPTAPTMSVDEVLALTQPTQNGQRHRCLFSLARGLKFECGMADATLQELKLIVRRWFDTASPKIGTPEFSESWSDFLHAWSRAKSPLSTNTLTAAWDAVQAGDLPAVAADYDSERVRSLIGLCYHLGHGKESFYLSSHKAGDLIGVKSSQVLRYMFMLEVEGVITIVKRGNRSTANTYKWVYQCGEEPRLDIDG